MCRTYPRPNRFASVFSLFVLATSAFFVTGCNWSEPKYKVRGTVVYSDDKKPIPGGSIGIEFESIKPPYPRSSGTVEADGSFELSTSERGDGAPEGEHRIRFTGATSLEQPDPQAALSAVMSTQYYEFATSGLKFDIKPNHDNVVNLEVKKPAPGYKPKAGKTPKEVAPRDPSQSPDT